MLSTYMQLTRGLRARLAYASFKATHNVVSVTLPELESLQLNEAAAYNHTFSNHANSSNYAYGGRYHPPTSTSTRTNYYDNPATQGNSAMIPASASHSSLTPLGAPAPTATTTPSNRRGSMAPPTAIPTARGSFGQSSSTSGGSNGHQSLYASILTLPPAKRARTIHNPEDPPVPAPKKMNNGGGGGPGTPTHHGSQSSTSSRHHHRRGSEQSASGAPLSRTGSGSGAFSSVAERTRGAQSSRTKPASSSNKTPSSSKRKKASSSSAHKESSSRKSKGKDRERDSHHSHSRKRQRAEYEMDLGGDVDIEDPMDLDMKAAATLTHLLRNSRSSFQSHSSVGAPSTVASGGAGALSPRSSISAGSDVGSSISQQFAQSSTRTTSHTNTTAANPAVDSSSSSFTSQASAAALMPATSSSRLRTPPMGNQTQGQTQAHAHDHQGSLTPKASSSVSASASASAAHIGGGGGGADGSGGTDGRAPSFPPDQVDQEALNLLTFFHTSPSPARPNTTRNRETQDAAAFRAFTRSISGGSASGVELRAKSRVLFPETGSGSGSTATIGESVGVSAGTNGGGGGTGGLAQRMLVRDNSGSAATLVGESIGGTPGRSRLGSATMIADETTSPTGGDTEGGSEGKVTPTQLLYKAHLNANKPRSTDLESAKAQQEESAVAAVLQATQLLPPPPSPSRTSLGVSPPSPSPSAIDVTSQSQTSQPPGTPPKQTPSGMGMGMGTPFGSMSGMGLGSGGLGGGAGAGGGFGTFNMHDFINVSPSPGFVASSRFARTGREGSVGSLSGLRADVGRKLFEG